MIQETSLRTHHCSVAKPHKSEDVAIAIFDILRRKPYFRYTHSEIAYEIPNRYRRPVDLQLAIDCLKKHNLIKDHVVKMSKKGKVDYTEFYCTEDQARITDAALYFKELNRQRKEKFVEKMKEVAKTRTGSPIQEAVFDIVHNSKILLKVKEIWHLVVIKYPNLKSRDRESLMETTVQTTLYHLNNQSKIKLVKVPIAENYKKYSTYFCSINHEESKKHSRLTTSQKQQSV